MLLYPFQTPANSPSLISKTRLFCHHNHDSSSDCSPAKKLKKSRSDSECIIYNKNEEESNNQLEHDSSVDGTNMYLTSTPACLPLRACQDIMFTPNDQDRKSMSPITRSTQRMTRAMQVCIYFFLFLCGLLGALCVRILFLLCVFHFQTKTLINMLSIVDPYVHSQL